MPSLDGATARRAYTLDGVVSRQDRHPTPPWRVVIVKGLRQKDSVSVGAATARDLIAVTARRPGSVLVRPILRLLRLAEVEHIEEIADRRHADRYVRVVATGDRVRKIVAAAVGERPPRSCSSPSTLSVPRSDRRGRLADVGCLPGRKRYVVVDQTHGELPGH